VQAVAEASEGEHSGDCNVVKQHRNDQSSRGEAIRITTRQPAYDRQRRIAAPPTRARLMAAGEFSAAPSRSDAVAEGKPSSAKPAPASMTAVTVCSFFMVTRIRRFHVVQRKAVAPHKTGATFRRP
jgi:hypothetical protein